MLVSAPRSCTRGRGARSGVSAAAGRGPVVSQRPRVPARGREGTGGEGRSGRRAWGGGEPESDRKNMSDLGRRVGSTLCCPTFWNFFRNGEKGEIKSRVLIPLLGRRGHVRACSRSPDPSDRRLRPRFTGEFQNESEDDVQCDGLASSLLQAILASEKSPASSWGTERVPLSPAPSTASRALAGPASSAP